MTAKKKGGVAAKKLTPSDAHEAKTSQAKMPRANRADAQRNLDALLKSAKDVFAESGVDAPVREIAARAGVGIGTLYRHFPQRSDLIAAVFRREIDACAQAADELADLTPFDALANWMQHYVAFVATKRGLAPALHSGDPAYDTLRGYFESRVGSVLKDLLQRAAQAGQVRTDVEADEILRAVSNLCMSAYGDKPEQAGRMVALLVDGLRYGV